MIRHKMIGYYKNLEEGQSYKISIANGGYIQRATLTKVTEKGFNFHNETTNKLVFRRHFYISNRVKKFYLSKRLQIIKNKE